MWNHADAEAFFTAMPEPSLHDWYADIQEDLFLNLTRKQAEWHRLATELSHITGEVVALSGEHSLCANRALAIAFVLKSHVFGSYEDEAAVASSTPLEDTNLVKWTEALEHKVPCPRIAKHKRSWKETLSHFTPSRSHVIRRPEVLHVYRVAFEEVAKHYKDQTHEACDSLTAIAAVPVEPSDDAKFELDLKHCEPALNEQNAAAVANDANAAQTENHGDNADDRDSGGSSGAQNKRQCVEKLSFWQLVREAEFQPRFRAETHLALPKNTSDRPEPLPEPKEPCPFSQRQTSCKEPECTFAKPCKACVRCRADKTCPTYLLKHSVCVATCDECKVSKFDAMMSLVGLSNNFCTDFESRNFNLWEQAYLSVQLSLRARCKFLDRHFANCCNLTLDETHYRPQWFWKLEKDAQEARNEDDRPHDMCDLLNFPPSFLTHRRKHPDQLCLCVVTVGCTLNPHAFTSFCCLDFRSLVVLFCKRPEDSPEWKQQLEAEWSARGD